ncbi:9841_t:CDS:2 [Entrophospora sp. SA101]|nr:9841_t:CDS:2 [Entrophospora sp. SA101]
MLADMVVGNTVKLMLPVETKKQKTTEEGTGVAMDIQSDGKKDYEESTQKKRNTVQHPISNLIQPYSVVTDIKKQKADITFGQLFQAVPKLRLELSGSLRTLQTTRVKKTTPQSEQLNAEIRSTVMYCKASINGRSFPIIIDSGAAGSIVSKGLLDKLGVKITINVNGQKTSPLGEVDDLPLTIGGITIPLSAIAI